MDQSAFAYILASGRNGTIYIGSSSDLVQRAHQHRHSMVAGFTRRHGCHSLVWYKAHDTIDGARHRELQMKKWKRLWKLSEIERVNPDWRIGSTRCSRMFPRAGRGPVQRVSAACGSGLGPCLRRGTL